MWWAAGLGSWFTWGFIAPAMGNARGAWGISCGCPPREELKCKSDLQNEEFRAEDRCPGAAFGRAS